VKDFVRDAMRHLGAEVKEEEEALAVTLPEDPEGPAAALLQSLGDRDLRLVFDSKHAGVGSQLIAPGSHLLRLLESLLEARGRRAYVVQPTGHRLTMKAVQMRVSAARGRSLGLTDRQPLLAHDIYVVYRLCYRSRTRVDAVETVRVRLRPPRAPAVEVVEGGVPDEAFEWDAKARKQAPADVTAQALVLSDAAIQARARDEGARLELVARQSFGRDVMRLHSYYSTQIADQRRSRRTDLATVRVEELEEERELRIRELVAAAQVRVAIEPLQLFVVEVPLQTARLVVRSKTTRQADQESGQPTDGAAAAEVAEASQDEVRVELTFNRCTGEMTFSPCPACASPLASGPLSACDAEHPVHQACLGTCGRCAREVCQACAPQPCGSGCEHLLCQTCAVPCRSCDAAGCQEHQAPCAVCGRESCGACLQDCAACREPVCQADRSLAGEGTRAVYCSRCASPCPGCETATQRERLIRCGTCGRRFCATCHPKDASACSLCRS
jgi:hypothetical protein